MNAHSTHSDGPVPDELMDRFHKANDHFHAARKNLEIQMEGTEPRHQERVNAAAEAVRAAERAVEEISEKIAKELHGDRSNPQDPSDRQKPSPPAHDQRVADFEPLR